MNSQKKRKKEELEDSSVGHPSTRYLIEKTEELQEEVEYLRSLLRKTRTIPSGRVGLMFIVPGSLLLVLSVILNSQVLAFLGLGLVLWGALFFFVKPERYVQSTLLTSTATPSYSTIDRMVRDLKCEGKSHYIPPYPKDVYLPEHLKGLKDMIVFIARAKTGRRKSAPSLIEIAKGTFLYKNPEGICLTPPGLGLLNQFEKELKTDMTRIGVEELFQLLPQVILENLQLAENLEITQTGNETLLKISDSIYKALYTRGKNLKSVHMLGCPLVSAVACATAIAAGKTVTIDRDAVSLDGMTIEFWFR
ncbi:MAG: hypothetical protein ACFE8V_16485, partial [Promethearchaeota archaeon]